MSSNQYDDWVRLELDNTAVYVKPESPDWIVPSASGDRLFQNIIASGP